MIFIISIILPILLLLVFLIGLVIFIIGKIKCEAEMEVTGIGIMGFMIVGILAMIAFGFMGWNFNHIN